VETDALRRHLEHELGELPADAVQALPGQLEVERVGRSIVTCDAGARLERRHDHAVVHHLDLDHMRGFAHRFGDHGCITTLDMEGKIAGRFVPQRRRVRRERRSTVDDRG